jgi:glycosidase
MNKYKAPDALTLVEDALKKKHKETQRRKLSYRVPSLWVAPGRTARSVKVSPYKFYLDVVRKAARRTPPRKGEPTAGEWSKDAVIYNMFVRTTAAFDHNGNGKLDLPVNSEGFRETGTFLKAIAMIPYIKSLGVNTIHLLPITSIGHDGNKGTLGSPYATRNPYELDENQSEPSLGLEAKTEFKAFVEAAHRAGMRVVLEFVFRTAAKDGDWVKEHPEWFYWIKSHIEPRDPHHLDETKYGSPIFTREELEHIHHAVSEHRFDNLLQPHQIYREFFTSPPAPETVLRVNGRYEGRLPDGTIVKVPGAFADWPPDDNQPPWGDVTYLRMYDHPDFNYIAYNTIRMYDTHLAQPQSVNRSLWERITGIIPYYQREFHIDGVMIDMGHALPMELKAEIVRVAREGDPDFAFWDENFSVNRRSREEGYNAVVGFVWIDQHHPPRMKSLCRRCATEGFPIPFFATPENHNTPRAAARPGGVVYARQAWVINCFLPAIPFIHSGYELAERYPINTGLDFTSEELKKLPSDKLPLFSEYAYDWLSKEQFTAWITRIATIREKYKSIVTNHDPQAFVMLHDDNDHILAFARVSPDGKTRVAVVCNMDYSHTQRACVRIETARPHLADLITRKRLTKMDGHVSAELQPGQCQVFEY